MKKKSRKYNDYHKMIDGVEYKQCKDCLEWFIMDKHSFGTDNANKDKFNMSCKKCLGIYNNMKYMEDRENRIEQARQWAKDHPERSVILNIRKGQTYKTKLKNRARSKRQKERGYTANYNKRPEVKARKYYENHRNHEISEKEWDYCKDYFKDVNGIQCCAYCGLKIIDHKITRMGVTKQGDFHKEHIYDDGANDLSNCIPACRNCNCGKWAFPFEEWYREQEFFTEERYNKIIIWTTEVYKKYIEEKLPYRIVRKKNKDNSKFHFQLWSIDESRNNVECLDTQIHKNDLDLTLI